MFLRLHTVHLPIETIIAWEDRIVNLYFAKVYNRGFRTSRFACKNGAPSDTPLSGTQKLLRMGSILFAGSVKLLLFLFAFYSLLRYTSDSNWRWKIKYEKASDLYRAFLLCAFHLPVSADGLRENEIINIGVIVNNDNSIEIIASTTKKTIGPTRAFLVFEEDEDPEQASAILKITTIGSAQTIHKKWSGGTPLFSNERFYEYTDENGMLKPGRYFAVVTEYESKREILTDRAYFTIPAIEQWWTPQPT